MRVTTPLHLPGHADDCIALHCILRLVRGPHCLLLQHNAEVFTIMVEFIVPLEGFAVFSTFCRTPGSVSLPFQCEYSMAHHSVYTTKQLCRAFPNARGRATMKKKMDKPSTPNRATLLLGFCFRRASRYLSDQSPRLKLRSYTVEPRVVFE